MKKNKRSAYLFASMVIYCARETAQQSRCQEAMHQQKHSEKHAVMQQKDNVVTQGWV